MKNIIKYSLIWVLIFSFFSCNEDYLKPKPLSFFAPENIFVNEAGFKSVLISMRKNLINEFTGSRGIMHHQYNTTEIAVAHVQLDFNQLLPGSDRYSQFVSQINKMYEWIKDANVVITRIDNIEWKDQEIRNTILAEALWHRAYWYYRLVHNYGDLPFVGEEISSARVDYNSHSRWAILEKIQSDLEYAVQYLPETTVPGAITAGAGNHLLTKVYLANLEFDKAIESATKVINGPYELMKDRFGVDASDPRKNVDWDLHRPENKNLPENKETILAIVDRFEAPDNARSVGLYTMRTYHSSWFGQRDSQGERGGIDAGPEYDSLGRGNSDALSTEWYTYDIWKEKGFNWDNTPDLRRSDINWHDVDEIIYNNPASVDYGKKWRYEWYSGTEYGIVSQIRPMPIYKTMVFNQNPNATPVGGNGDWYVFRLAGTYLLRAEAYYWKGNLAAAAADINAVRERSLAVPITAEEATIDYIFDERARELFAETPRFNEMVRVSYIMARQGLNGYSEETINEKSWWYDRVINLNYFYPNYTGTRKTLELWDNLPVPIGDKFIVIGQSARISPWHIHWPIDANLISANTLGVINQNVGYPGAEKNKPPLTTIE